MQIGYIVFKSTSDNLNNKNIRKALLYSIDRELISNKVSYGMRRPLRAIIPPIFQKSEDYPWPKYNPKIASKILKESCFCNNKRLILPLTFRSNVPADKLLALTWKEQVRRDLSDCLEITLNGVESTTVYKQLAEEAGRQAVRIVGTDLIPSKLINQKSIENAIRCIHAIGGSTNSIIHLIAIAGRVGIKLPLELFDELAKTTPFILNLKPSGKYLMEDFYYAGGVPAMMQRISHLLNLDAETITGKSLGENIKYSFPHNDDIIRSVDNALDPEGGLAVLKGNLAPTGAIIKPTAASSELMVHKGRAVVFEDHDDLAARIDDPGLEVSPEDVLVMRNSGPVGAPGIPEWGFLPIPKKILATGVRDMVRLSDARMSGTAFGTVVVHVTPESANGGPLSAVRNGDIIEIDVPNRKLNVLISDDEMKSRISEKIYEGPKFKRGFKWLHARHILQADQGCDFDFLIHGELFLYFPLLLLWWLGQY